MTPKAEKLLPRIEKAGVKAALKAGHPLSRDELLEVRVQLLPALFRWSLGGVSAAMTYGSYLGFTDDKPGGGFGMGFLALIFFFFAVVGIRRTFSHILDNLSIGDATDLLELALEGIGSAVVSLFDGV